MVRYVWLLTYPVLKSPPCSYPYTATTGTCQTSTITGTPGSQRASNSVNYFTLSPARSRDSLKRFLMYRPVVIYFTVDGPFQMYGGGIYYPTAWCNSNAINHAMLLVGWYDVPGQTPYWSVRERASGGVACAGREAKRQGGSKQRWE